MGKSAQRPKHDWKIEPPHQAYRDGCKVSWKYYASEEDAKAASIAARHNARIKEGLGYDFGYCDPGSIAGPNQQNWHPGLYEVCMP